MRYKIEHLDHWQKIIAPNSFFSFSTVSPISCISGPHIAYAWAGIGSMVSGVSIPIGTIIGCRIDKNDSLPLNLDYWKLNCVGALQLVEVRDIVNKSEIPEHWSIGIPTIFQTAPESIKELILNKQE